MKLFSIYIKKSPNQQTGQQEIEDLVVVKNGFSCSAFLFNIFWFVQHKMWKEFATLLLINVIFGIVFQRGFWGGSDPFILEVGLMLIIAINAGYWYGQHLQNHNYQFFGCVFGKNRDEAKLRFIENYFKKDGDAFCPPIIDLKKPQEPTEQYFTA